MQELGIELERLLRSMGADLVGYGDVSDMEGTGGLNTGVAFAMAMPRDLLRSIEGGGTAAAAGARPVVQGHERRARPRDQGGG